jgi:hypothetical protein
MNGAHPQRLTHIEVRQHPEWHGMTTLPGLAADQNGEPVYEDPVEASAVPQDANDPDAGADEATPR